MKHDASEKQVLLVTQKDAITDNPKEDDLYKIGILGNILQMLKLPDGTVKVLVEGIERVKITKFIIDFSKFKHLNSPSISLSALYHQK